MDPLPPGADEALAAAEDPLRTLAPVLGQLTALADEEHLTRAAAACGVPQPTLSRAVARWEAALGVPLLVRRGRGVALTDHGRTLAEAAREARGALERAVRAVREDAGLDHGRVRFAFLQTMGPDVVPRLLRAFRAVHPGVHVELRQGSPAENLAALGAGTVDLVLTAPPPAPGRGLQTWALGSQPVALAVALDHPLARRSEVGVAEALTGPVVGMARGFGMRTITDSLSAAVGRVPDLAFEAQDLDTLLGLVAAGLGVALVPVVPDRDGNRRRDVALVPLAGRPRREIVLAALAGQARTAAVAAFVDTARELGSDLV